jgi:hypothetical protein
MFVGLLGLLAYNEFVGFATGGELSGDSQSVFNELPTISLVLTVAAVGAFVVAAVVVVFEKARR